MGGDENLRLPDQPSGEPQAEGETGQGDAHAAEETSNSNSNSTSETGSDSDPRAHGSSNGEVGEAPATSGGREAPAALL